MNMVNTRVELATYNVRIVKRIGFAVGLSCAVNAVLISNVSVYAKDIECLQSDQWNIQNNYLGNVTVQESTLIDNLVVDRSYDRERYAIITQFCDTMLGIKEKWNIAYTCFDYDGFRYDPRQSLFVYALCVNMDKRDTGEKYKPEFEVTYPWDITTTLKDMIKKDLDLNKIWWIPTQAQLDADTAYSSCDPKWSDGKASMQACNFSAFAPHILETVMNDYSNLILAALYGYKYGKNKDERKKAIHEFSMTHFKGDAADPQAPCNDPTVDYLQDTPYTLEGDKKHCSHPQTYKMVDQLLQGVAQLTEKTDMLDAKEVFKLDCKDRQGTLHACAFSTTWTIFAERSWEVYKNLLTNELMYYSIFLDYYTNLIVYDAKYNPLSFENLADTMKKNGEEVQLIAQEKQLAMQATTQMMRMLSNFYALYPIHIWLSAYYEDLVQYRDILARMYTPLHQLFFYLLRNTQEKNQ